MRLANIVIISCLAVVGVAAEGCSSSSSGTSTPAPGVGEHKSVDIKAAEGGSLAATGGSITIPPGALAADTTITVDVKDKSAYASSSDVAVNVFDFGPNGTKFLKPVAMTIDLQGVSVPSGKTAKIAYYDGSAWKTLDDSQVANGKVTATTTHFTPFTVVFSGGAQTGGSCGSFSACGGDLTGTWKFSAACATVPTTALGSPWSTCTGATIAATIDMQGAITFNADKTYTVSDTMTRTIDGTLPKTCLGSGQTCQSIIDASKGDTATDTGTDCKVTGKQTENTSNETGTWATAGTTFTTTKTGGSSSSPTIAYCITGNTLVAQQQGDKGVMIQYTATKQ